MITDKIQYLERQSFHMEPDCYDGNNCERFRPRWMTSYPKEGKCEDGETLEFKLAAATMPPGTRITIEVPCCPKCGDPADALTDPMKEFREWPKCKCGFSWKKWTEEQFA